MVSNVTLPPDNTAQPFEDMRALIGSIPVFDADDAQAAKAAMDATRVSSLSPLGYLQKGVTWLAGMQGRVDPKIDRPLIALFAGTHGVAQHIIEDADIVTPAKARVEQLTKGTAGVRGISSAYQAAFKVFEMGIEHPCADMTVTSSLTERECAAAIAFGMEVVAEGADIIVLGNAGFGSATAAAAITHSLYGGTVAYWSGDQITEGANRIKAVETARELHKDDLSDPLDVLRCFGGRDIAGIAGAIIAAGHQRIPVLLDGYVVCAAAAILHKINPNALDHCFAAHVSQEPAHGALLDRLGRPPMMDLGIGIGDGSGAAIVMGNLMAATKANAIYLNLET